MYDHLSGGNVQGVSCRLHSGRPESPVFFTWNPNVADFWDDAGFTFWVAFWEVTPRRYWAARDEGPPVCSPVTAAVAGRRSRRTRQMTPNDSRLTIPSPLEKPGIPFLASRY